MGIIEANGGDIETYLRRYISRDSPGAWIDKRTGQVHLDLDFETPVGSVCSTSTNVVNLNAPRLPQRRLGATPSAMATSCVASSSTMVS
jgi:hypothetical protein